jgi:hypothetical protein
MFSRAREALVHAARIRQHPQSAPHCFGILGDVDAIHAHAAAVGCHQRVEHAQGGGFAGAVGAQQAGDLAVFRGKADPINGFHQPGLGFELLV